MANTEFKTYWDTADLQFGRFPSGIIEFDSLSLDLHFRLRCKYFEGFLVLEEIYLTDRDYGDILHLLCDCFEEKEGFGTALKDLFGPNTSVHAICIRVYTISVMITDKNHDPDTIIKTFYDNYYSMEF